MKKFLMLLVAALCVVTVSAQTRTVRGVVSSNDGEPIVGASVLVEGTSMGAQTDIDGRFAIPNVPSDARFLRVSYVGMTSQQVAITPGEIKIVLSLNSEMLDEVVVTAMGISRSEKSLGFSATQVSAAEIEKAQTANVMEALQGKVAGLSVQSVGASPGTTNNVMIRGIGSITGSNQPLYVVDGVPMANRSGNFNVATGGVSNISPEDIASLTVLKGAAATALYGSRATNGAILITTKSGSANGANNFSITYSGNIEANRVAYLPDMQNSWGQGWNGQQTYNENGSWGPRLNGTMQPYGPIYNGQQLVGSFAAVKNNVRDFFETGFSQVHSIALSGTSKDGAMNYYASYSYTDQDGIYPTDQDSYKRNTFALRASYQPKKWIKVSTSMNFANYATKSVDADQGLFAIDGLYEMPRNIPISYLKDLNNQFNQPGAYYTPYGITNPYWALENVYTKTEGKQIYGKFQVDLFPIKDLTLTYRFGFDYGDYDYKYGQPQVDLTNDPMLNWNNGQDYSSDNQTGIVSATYARVYETTNDFLANYTKKLFDNRFDINATLGVTINERGTTSMGASVQNLTIETGWWDMANGATISSVAESQSKRRNVGLFADIALGWDDFLFMDISMRNDWTSTLPIGDNSYFYPGVTLSAVFTRWLQNKDVLSFGKIRLAYGRTGSDPSAYLTSQSYLQAYTVGRYVNPLFQFPFSGANAFMVSNTAANKNLRPEMTSEFEIGTNLKFFNGRIELDASYYNRETDDQISYIPLDPSTGFSYQYVNFGKVRNRGVELMMNFIPIQTRDWTWEIGFNWTKNWNKVISLPEGSEGNVVLNSFSTSNDQVLLVAEQGKPIGQFYTYLPTYVDNPSSEYYGSIVVDDYGLPVVDKTEAKATGKCMQHLWTGGVTTSLRWKNLTLSAAFDIRYGGYMISRTKNLMQFTGNGIMTAYNDRNPFIIPGSVVSNGDGTYSPNTTPLVYSQAQYNSMQDYYDNGRIYGGEDLLLDRTYAKLRNLSLTWSLPKKWLSKICLQQVDLTVYGNNLFMWTAKENRFVDPETTNYSINSEGDVGVMFGELYTNPSYRTFGFNLKVTY